MRKCYLTINVVVQWLMAVSTMRLEMNSPMPGRVSSPNRTHRTILSIPAIINYGGIVMPMGPMCTEGMKIALEKIEEQNQILPNYSIEFLLTEELCKHSIGVTSLVNTMRNASQYGGENMLPLIVGPICGENGRTGEIVKYFNFINVADASVAAEAYNRQSKRYKSFHIFQHSVGSLYRAIPHFIRHNGWKRVFLLTEAKRYWENLELVLHESLNQTGITLSGTSIIIGDNIIEPTEAIHTAVKELAAKNPKVIIVNTNFGGSVACSLYNVGLFGPDIVYLWFGTSFFWPTTKLRLANCTDTMISEVLKSIIFFAKGTPLAMESKESDMLGMTPTMFESQLMERIVDPQLSDVWFFWRGMCYSQTVGTMLVLDQVEKHLREHFNDSLINWTTSSKKFQTRPDFIAELINSQFEQLDFQGLSTYKNRGINNPDGISGFFQMQRVNSKVKNQFKIVPVALVNTSESRWQVETFSNLKWQTVDNQPPLDGMRYVTANVPLVQNVISYVTIAVSIVCFISNLVYSIVAFRKKVHSHSHLFLPKLDILFTVGNGLLPIASFLLPYDASRKAAPIQMMIATFALVVGLTLVLVIMIAKLELGRLVLQLMFHQSRTSYWFHKKSKQSLKNSLYNQAKKYLNRNVPVAESAALVVVVVLGILIIIWFSVEPIRSEGYQMGRQISPVNPSIVYIQQAVTCSLPNTNFSYGFLYSISICFIAIIIWGLKATLTTRKTAANCIPDLNLIRMTLYTITGIMVVGVLLGGLLYPKQPDKIFTVIAIDIVSIELAITTVLLVPKLIKITK